MSNGCLVLSLQDSGITSCPVKGAVRCGGAGDTGEGEEEWIDPSLMSVLMGKTVDPCSLEHGRGGIRGKLTYLS